MPKMNVFEQRDALQPVGALKNYEVPWCPNEYSDAVGPDIGPPKFAITTQKDGSVVAALQRQVAFVGTAGAATTCDHPATFTTAAYTDTYTLAPASGDKTAPTQTLSGYACQGPLTWKMLPYSYAAASGVVVDDGAGNGKAVAAALRLKVPYLPSGVAGGAGCAATVFATQAYTDVAYLAPGTITALPPSSTAHASSQPTSVIPSATAPVASPSATATPGASGETAARVGAAVGALLVGALAVAVWAVCRKVRKRRAAREETTSQAPTPRANSRESRAPTRRPPQVALRDIRRDASALV